MGELHLDIMVDRLRREFNLNTHTGSPQVAYRETITKPGQEIEGKSPNKHNKLYFKVEPLTKEVSGLLESGEIPEMRIKKKDLTYWCVI